MDVSAKATARYEFTAVAHGADGYSVDLGELNNSFRCWRAIVRWNLHNRNGRCLLGNVRDLFTKVLREKLWRHS